MKFGSFFRIEIGKKSSHTYPFFDGHVTGTPRPPTPKKKSPRPTQGLPHLGISSTEKSKVFNSIFVFHMYYIHGPLLVKSTNGFHHTILDFA